MITTPAYVYDLLDALLTGAPLNFHGHPVPGDVQIRILRGLRHRAPTGPAQPDPAPAATAGAGAESPVPVLTQRELDVLRGMAEGAANKAIGEALFISEDTVKTHARRLFRKLHARDRAHAVALGFRTGILKVSAPHTAEPQRHGDLRRPDHHRPGSVPPPDAAGRP